MSTTIRDLLNEARWRDENLAALEVVVVHRGAPDGRRTVAGSRIMEIGATGIEVEPDSPEAEPTFLPYHRVLSVLGPGGAVMWEKTRRAPSGLGAAPIAASYEGREIEIDHAVVLRDAVGKEPMVIDGSAGEGGGQILRTALTLSLLTGTPFVLEKIRARRPRTGLLRQHVTCIRAAAAVSGAEVKGAALGSPRLVFRPGRVRGGDHTFDIGSAGSVALVLQTLALPLALARGPSLIVVRGGTHAKWAPIFPFLELAWLPLMRRANALLELELRSVGFHPAGGGEVALTTRPQASLAPLHLPDPEGRLAISLDAIVSHLAESIADRELRAAADRLGDPPDRMSAARVPSPGPGNAMWLTARDAATGLVNVFSAVGERGVPAESVAAEVADRFLAWRASRTSVEAHLADQLMLPVAIAGEGSFTCDELSLHATTNAAVIEAFTGKRIRCFALGEGRFRVALASRGSG